ncbi:MAG: hypothetical protein WBW31_12270 [Candidatus Sulfotelmatobacter sp.]
MAVIVIAAIFAGVGGWTSVSPLYRSTAIAVVIPPGGGSPDAQANPLINLNPEIVQLAAVVARALETDRGREAAVQAGGTGDFAVDTVTGNSPAYQNFTPQLMITADGSDPESARRSAAALVELARATLQKIQLDSDVPVVNNALLISSVEPQAGSKLPTGPARRAGAYARGTILIGVVLLLLSDAFLERIRGRSGRGGQKAPAEDELRASMSGYANGAIKGNSLAGQHWPADARPRQAPPPSEREAVVESDARTAATKRPSYGPKVPRHHRS